MSFVEALRVAGGLALVPVLMGTALLPPDDAETVPAAGFRVYHFASEVEGRAFREVFLVHDVTPGFSVRPSDLEIRLNGEALGVAWLDEDGAVSVNDRFSFVQEAFDEKQVITAHHEGRQVMECRFGGGAGLSIHPDEWRELGYPEQVRCLELTDDQ